jgi:hypothetical protein
MGVFVYCTLKLQVFDSEYYFKINLKTLCTEQYFRYDSLQKITMKSLVKEFFLKGGNYKKKIIQGIIIMFTSTIKKKMPSIFAYYFNVI